MSPFDGAQAMDALSRFATTEEPGYVPAPLKPAPGGVHLLAFDQSLSDTGWVYLHHGTSHTQILDAGNLKAPGTKEKGVSGTLVQGESMHFMVRSLMESKVGVSRVAYETPATGPKMMRTEASLVAALGIRIAARERGLQVSQHGAQSGKKFVCGIPNAEKKVAHAALARHFGTMEGYELITNEARRDALLVALVALSA